MTINNRPTPPPNTHTAGAETVPLCSGPPTREELLAHYPAKFTWRQLKTFVNSGDLGLLKRDKTLQKRYDIWAVGIKAQYGSMVKYLEMHRLQWGKPDALSLLTSVLDGDAPAAGHSAQANGNGNANANNPIAKPDTHDEPHEYFVADTPEKYVSIIQNDWPYSVPPEIEHTLIWTRLPIFHPSLVPSSISARVHQDGLWGFTGASEPPPDPSTLPDCLPALAEWGVTMDKLIRSERGSDEEETLVRNSGREVDGYVRRRWKEAEWETAWFVNPPRLQSVPGLAHIHVFARHKSPDEIRGAAQPNGRI